MGRNSFDMASDRDGYTDNYEFQVPLFVLTHQPPIQHPKENDKLTFTFVTDGIESAISQAKAAGNGKDVLCWGRMSASSCFESSWQMSYRLPARRFYWEKDFVFSIIWKG